MRRFFESRLIRGIRLAIENIVRLPLEAANPREHLLEGSRGFSSIRRAALMVAALTPVYGMFMGSFACVAGHRTLLEQMPQIMLSAIKLPILIVITVALSLPSFFVLNTLCGLRDDFGKAMSAIISSQAGFAIGLVSLFPITLFFYFSVGTGGASYRMAVIFNALMFTIAALAAHRLLLYGYRPLVALNARHRWMIGVWLFLFAFVGIQAGWTMRPFIGNPGGEVSFFRPEPLSNAYLQVGRIFVGMFTAQ